MDKKKILFIVNPISGIGKQKKIERFVLKYLDMNKFSYNIRYTEYAGHASIIAKESVEQGYDVVVAVGGDGSINEVVNGMIHSDMILGIIPSGSGNGLARHLGLPYSIKKSILVLNRINISEIDVFEINGRYCVSIAGIGFDALVAKKFDGFRRRGFFGYLGIVGKEYFLYKEKKYKLIIGDQEYKRRAFLVSLANSNQFGYNTYIAPQADIRDGMLDICVFKKVPIYHILLYTLLLFAKRIDKTNYMEVIRASEFVIKRKRKKVVNIDGEPVKMGKKLHVKVYPKSLKVLIS